MEAALGRLKLMGEVGRAVKMIAEAKLGVLEKKPGGRAPGKK